MGQPPPRHEKFWVRTCMAPFHILSCSQLTTIHSLNAVSFSLNAQTYAIVEGFLTQNNPTPSANFL